MSEYNITETTLGDLLCRRVDSALCDFMDALDHEIMQLATRPVDSDPDGWLKYAEEQNWFEYSSKEAFLEASFKKSYMANVERGENAKNILIGFRSLREAAKNSTHEKIASLQRRLAEAEKAKDGAYKERDSLVSAISKVFPACLERHPDEDKDWEDDWRWIVYIDLPAGQASWHIHDSELDQFDHLPRQVGCEWDGHTTEEKYKRLASLDKDQDLAPDLKAASFAGFRRGVEECCECFLTGMDGTDWTEGEVGQRVNECRALLAEKEADK